MFDRIKAYFVGAKQEFRTITWPTPLETRSLTIIVIGLSLLLSIFLGAFDYLFTYLLGIVLS
jgi:preprotein translocase SecE subunit